MLGSNHDAAEIHRWRYERAVRDYKAGGSEAVLKASLKCAGYYGVRLADELKYLVGCGEDKVKKGFVSGLPERAW